MRKMFLPKEKWSEYGKADDEKLGTNREKYKMSWWKWRETSRWRN